MEKINFYTQSSLNDTPELRMVIDVSGNVGIGESNPTKALEVAGDISFNGNLYQNGSLFVGGGGGLTDLSATSISDLSDVSFNSTTTTQGNTLIWNNTDKVWEAGTPTTSIVNTINTQTITPSWNQITTSGTVGTMTAYSDLLVYNDNGTDYLIFSIGWTGSAQSNKTYRYNISTSTWGELTTSNTLSARYASTAVIYNNNYYLLGGRISANLNETWKLDLTTNAWSQLSTSGTAPEGRRYTNSDIYNGNLIIFGGYGSNALNDVWKLNLTTLAWTQIHDGTGTAPPARYIHSVNITGDNLYVFGGVIPGLSYNDTWKFDLTTNTWSQLSTTGTTPSARRVSDAIIYNNKLYIFGGINGSGTYINDLWELNLSTLEWNEIDDGTAPSARVEFRVALYNDKMYLFGGNDPNGALNDTWEFTFPQYTTTYNPVEINKLSTYYALSVGPNYDTSNMDNSGNLIVEGNVGIGLSDPSGYKLEVAGDISFNGSLYQNGALFTGGSTIDETTDVSLNNLFVHGDLSANDASFNVIDATSLRINGVDIIDGAPAALDTLSELAAALDNSANFATNVLTTLSNKQDTLTAGTNITITGNTISASGGGGGLTDLSATSINDLSDVSFNSTTTTDGQALVWNSTDGVWEADTPRTTLTQVITTNIPPEWSQITASSGTPNANASHAGTIHGDYFYVFAGGNVNNLMYKFHLTTRVWSQVSYSTSGTIPSELYGNLMFSYGNYVYSVFGSRHVSGYPSTNTVLRYDTTNNTLYEVSTSGSTVPTRQAGAIALYNDNGTDYLYYFGGRGSSYYNDMYRLNLSNHSWSSVTTTGGPPDTRYYISHTYTSTKLYIYGGDRSSGDHANDTWEFDLTNNTWTQLQDGTGTAPQGSYGAAMVYNNNKLYIFGGSKTTSGDITDETWKFNLSDNTWTQLSFSTTPGTKYSPAYATDSSNNLYIHGGYNSSYVFQSTIWKLTLSESTSVTTNYIQGLDVNGDISFNGSLYQNGTLFTGGSTINETTDVSMNNTTIHGILDVSTNFTAGGRTSTTTTTTSETIQWYTNQSNFTWSLTNDGTSTAPTARKNHSSIIDNSSNIVVFGGYDSTNSETNDVWKYNITNNTWSQLFTSTTPSDGAWDQITGSTATSLFEGATVYNNEIYVISDSHSKFEKYNPSTNTWTTLSAPSGVSFYSYHQMVSYNGHIYLVDNVNGYRSVWDYNISTSSWSQISNDSDTSHDRYNAAIIVYNNNIYILGGRHIPYTGGFFNDIWKFNLTNNTWSEITGTTVTLDSNSSSMPSIAYSYFTSKDDNLYMFGGTNGTQSNKLYIYNVTNNTLTGYTTSISARDSGTASIQDNYLYLFGGYTGSNLNELIKYDLNTHTHTTISQSGTWPSARRDIQAKPVTIGNTFYVIGGYISGHSTEIWRYTLDNTPNKMKHSSSVLNGDETVTIFGGSNGSTYYNSIYNFNLVSNSWSYSIVVKDNNASDTEHGNSSGIPSSRHGHTSVEYNNKMYMFGGKDGNTTYYDTWEYDLTTTTWTKKALAPSSYARYEHTSIIYNGDMYVFGGYDGTNYFNNILKYDITNDTWSEYNDGTSSGTPTARYGHISVIMQNEMIIFGGTTQSGHVEDSYMFNFVDSSWNLLDNDDSNRPTDSYSTTAEIQYYNPTDNHYKLFVFGGETPLTNKLYVADISRNNVTNTTSTTIPNVLIFNSTNGRVGIGTNTPSKSLDVVGDGLFSGTVTANGSVLSSDDRIKHNEQPITNALSTISKITPKHYFKTGSTLYDATHNFPLNSQNQPLSASGTPLLLNKDYTLETGIIAQELRSIPELSFAVQNTTPLGVDYNSIHCTHIAATKELHQLVQSQQTTIQTHETTIQSQQTQIEEQQNEIEHLKMVNIDMNNQLVTALEQLEHIKRYLAI